MAHSPNLCAPFSRRVRHMYAVYVEYSCTGYFPPNIQNFESRVMFECLYQRIYFTIGRDVYADASALGASEKKIQHLINKCASPKARAKMYKKLL